MDKDHTTESAEPELQDDDLDAAAGGSLVPLPPLPPLPPYPG